MEMLSKENSDHSTIANEGSKTGRRELLVAIGMTLGSGCIEEAQSLVSRDRPEQISISIKTLPADADPWAIRIARFLTEQLNAVGIAAQVEPMDRVELRRDILLNQSFDCYIACHPGFRDPDILRTLLHSRFGTEAGWQNPFGYANLRVDKLLAAQQRQSGQQRMETLRELQLAIARDQPFTVIAFPDEIRAIRTNRFAGWSNQESVHTLLGYLSVRSRGSSDQRLRMTLQDSRPTENLNPLSVEYRYNGTILDLLYDPVGRWINGRVRPWLAKSWDWQSSTDNLVAEINLRDGLWWHDNTALTANDVAFTYEFLKDTTLGTQESPVPSPRFREGSSIIKSVKPIDKYSLRVNFGTNNRAVGRQALTIPVLPKHIWRSKHKQAKIAGLQTDSAATKALIWNNMQPVGSGPFQFHNVEHRQSLTLKRFDRHFLAHTSKDYDLTSESEYIERYAGGVKFKQLQFLIVPSAAAATKLILNGEADGTATSVTASEVRNIGHAEDVELFIDESLSMYHLGFNTRKAPFSNVRFRRSVAQLLDKAFLVQNVFGGYAEPGTSPLARHDSLAPELRWTGTDSELPFPGENGNLNVAKAKAAFKDAGYRYTKNGKLLRR
ncbi:ABC transporter substrate-binding protein [Haladaptatus salinisoli]|uniref:ABC transporter substrate-binding protein n=1 Tax=Haladaptatus salinisoli TaxID=2884876 RepID=UPI001D0A8ADB|nr:ABC transporter substrate-binding protein [Haladaptatus salinisoli]